MNKTKTKGLILISLFAALTAIGAFIKIPIPYVPITLQLLFCVYSGILLGQDGAVFSLLYLAVGLIGIPIFTNRRAFICFAAHLWIPGGVCSVLLYNWQTYRKSTGIQILQGVWRSPGRDYWALHMRADPSLHHSELLPA